MPIYDYQCTACGHRIEVVHGLNEGGPAACALCGGGMKKLFAPPSIHFKGTGWAKKERASSSAPRSAKTPASEGATGGPGEASSAPADGTAPAAPTTPAPGTGAPAASGD